MLTVEKHTWTNTASSTFTKEKTLRMRTSSYVANVSRFLYPSLVKELDLATNK